MKLKAIICAVLVSFLAACHGGDKDDNGREDNKVRYNDGSTSGRTGSTTNSTTYTPVDHTAAPKADSLKFRPKNRIIE